MNSSASDNGSCHWDLQAGRLGLPFARDRKHAKEGSGVHEAMVDYADFYEKVYEKD